MQLLPDNAFDEDQCWALLARNQVGRVACTFAAVPVVLPVRYALFAGELYLAARTSQHADSLHGSVVVVQSDGYDEEMARHWSVLAIGSADRVTTLSEDPTWVSVFSGPGDPASGREPASGPGDPEAATSWAERYIVHLHTEILSGGWFDL